MNDLNVDKTSGNKSFLAREIKRLIQEHKAALETISPHEKIKRIYDKKIQELNI